MRCLVVVVVFVCACVPSLAHADGGTNELFCGQTMNVNNSWQYGTMRAVEAIVQTRRDSTFCPLEVQVEAWVNETAYSASVNRNVYVAEVWMIVPVPTFGIWQTYGKHWLIWWFGTQWTYLGTTVTAANVSAPTVSREDECLMMGGWWNGESCDLSNTPVIVDVAHDGYRLTSADDGVRFDLDADGTPELTAWTEPDSDEAFLALDRNGNGRIDDGSELFGNRTSAYANEREPATANGFEALKFAEGPTYGPSRADFVIDPRDAIFSRLLLWRDANHNGVSEPDELTPVRETDLLAIDTHYKEAGRVDRYGNRFRLRAKGTWQNGEFYIYDVWLKSR